MSGPSLSGKEPERIAKVQLVTLERSVETPAQAQALFRLMRTHARSFGFTTLEKIEVHLSAEFSAAAEAVADPEGFKAKLEALWPSGTEDAATGKHGSER